MAPHPFCFPGAGRTFASGRSNPPTDSSMIATVLRKIFGSRNDRLIKRYAHSVRAINVLEPEIERLSDAELRAKTPAFKQRLANGETLDQLLPEAFAVVREAGKRALEHAPLRRPVDRRHGAAPRQDRRDAHRRRQDAGGHAAGLSQRTVRQGCARGDGQRLPGQPRRRLDGPAVRLPRPDRRREPVADGPAAKQQAYAADITYGTNNEFGFDYLRDNMVYGTGDRVQRELNYAIVDEVDSILIDEARTPLIISGQAEDTTDLYYRSTNWCPSSPASQGERAGRLLASTRKPTRCCSPKPVTSMPRSC